MLCMCLTAQNNLAGDGSGISEEIIILEIRSPDVCDLTLIDLPGIARVPLEGQPSDIGTQVGIFFFFQTKFCTVHAVLKLWICVL